MNINELLIFKLQSLLKLAKKIGRIMKIKREKYLNEIIERNKNNLIKVITGLRKSSKYDNKSK